MSLYTLLAHLRKVLEMCTQYLIIVLQEKKHKLVCCMIRDSCVYTRLLVLMCTSVNGDVLITVPASISNTWHSNALML